MKKILFTFLILATATLNAQSMSSKIPTVSITGTGTVYMTPDGVTINVKIENEGTTAMEVKQLNDQSIDASLKFLKKSKINPKKYQTDYIRINKNYNYQTKEYKYVASQSLVIHLDDLSKYEEIMQGLFENGVNNINNVAFTSSKIKELKSEARKKAILNAKTKAEEYVSVLDQQVGKALEISETSIPNYVSSPNYMLEKVENGPLEETIAAGQTEITVNISVVFELK
ncbi:SIMPL domain-containing protein [Neptunitalea chrysea]|uniref:SIMPL domain-containing protein n=1 Tax=Neptunitalea chrysea TaxID=1647581 RepID=A0A9W6B6V2_9FLAO|nr:SIMPL domain-containing protein [Neptunitalea chrysea]GLB51808.1 SIMPL domain-containing protein [Neptunitalea chrysea]